MKRIIAVVLVLISFNSFGQDTPYVRPVTYTKMASNYWFSQQGKFDSVLQARKAIFRDTVAFRSVTTVPMAPDADSSSKAASTKWIKQNISPGMPGMPTSVWQVNGNYRDTTSAMLERGEVIGMRSNYKLQLLTNDSIRMVIDSNGINRSSGAANKVLMIDTATKKVYYADMSAEGGGGTTDTTKAKFPLYVETKEQSGADNDSLKLAFADSIALSPKISGSNLVYYDIYGDSTVLALPGGSDPLKLNISDTAAMLANYAKQQALEDSAAAIRDSLIQINLSGLRDNDLLKYDSVNNRFVNFRLNVNTPLEYNYSTNTLSTDTTTAITGLATKAYVLNNAGSGGGGSGWGLTGNAGITAYSNFLGTTDAKTFRMRVNNTEFLMADSSLKNTYIGNYVAARLPAKLKVVGATGTNWLDAVFKAYANDSSGIFMGHNVASNYSYLGAVKEGVGLNDLYINAGNVSIGTSTFSDKLRVAGLVRFGTGTGSPTFTTSGLIVNQAGRTTAELLNSSLNIDAYWMADNNGDVNGTILGTITNHPIGFRTNNITRMYLHSTGVGIGTTTPSANLHIKYGSTAAGSSSVKLSTNSIATTAASGTGSVVTLTFAAQPAAPFAAGTIITVTGVTPSGYNGTWTVTSSTTTSVTFPSSATGAQTVAGFVQQGVQILTTPEAGVIEPDDKNLNFTNSYGNRYKLANTLTNTATLDFASTGAGAVSDLTITVTGAADGDPVSVGVPNASNTATATFTAWVSAANTVTIRYSPKATEDPASGVFRVSVLKY